MKKQCPCVSLAEKVTVRLLKQANDAFLAAIEKEKARESKKTAGKRTVR